MGRSQAKMAEENAREYRLHQAIANDDVDDLHNLIMEEPELLDRLSKRPFPDTPLHIAAAAGKTDVAMELATLKPSFARKLNPKGYSPMHLALENKHYDTVRALMILNPNLVRVRGRRGITPLHYVAEKDGANESELLAEFLLACSSSIKDLTSQYETAVHVAVRNRNLEAIKVLLGWIRRVHLTEILGWKDKDGNTAFQIAVLETLPEIINLFNWNRSRVPPKISRWIAEHLTPDRSLTLSPLLSMEPTWFEKSIVLCGPRDESARNVILMVATFVATAMYQAGLTPPGGYWQDDFSNSTVVTAGANSSGLAVEKPHQAGKTILTGPALYTFTFFNSLVFLTSILTIWITAIPLLPHTLPVYTLMVFLGGAYFSNALFGIPKSDTVGAVLIVYIYMILLFAGLVVPTFLWIKYFAYRLRLNATARCVGNFPE